MKKTHSGSKFANRSRALRFETLEARTLLAANPTLLSSFAALEVTPADELECVAAESFPDSSSVVSKTNTGVTESDSGYEIGDADTTSWYALVTGVNPSANEQELLEQINRLRTDPQGELDRVFSYYDDDVLVARNSLVNDAIKLNSYPKDSIEDFLEMWSNLTAQSPLAFNSSLETAATSHSTFMKTRNDVSHKCSGEDALAVRVAKAGFESGLTADGSIAISENIGGCFSSNGDFSVASYMLAAFAVDWGVPTHEHLDAMLNAAYSEIGVSIMQTSKSIGPYIVTCDFGTSSEGARTDGAYLLGVVFDDVDSDFFYDAGEGLGNLSIKIERTDGSGDQSVTIESWDSGGYQIFLLNGSYDVTVSGDGFSTSVTKSVTISDGVNAKLDFRTDEVGASAPVVDLNGEEDGTDAEVVFIEGSEDPMEVFNASSVSVIDLDSTNLYGAKIYFGARPDGDSENLDVSVAGSELSASYDDQMGSITITGTGTVAEYEDVIASLTYFNSNETCDLTSERNVKISVYDGVFWSEEATLSISIKPTNLPTMTVHEMAVYEGDEGAKIATFEVELDSPARLDVSFNFNVAEGGSALEGYEYVLSKGDPIIITAGETSATIECYVNGNYEALKPEGLKAVDGGFENPFTYFDLKIVDVENAFLSNEGGLVRGTIYDDDSPVILGTTNEYSLANALSTDGGDRRYVFTVTPESGGYYSWSADALGLPSGMTITVRENSLDSDAIAESIVVETGGRVQWFADPGVEYWITIESTSDVALISARLLEVTDEKVVLIDPLLEDSAESLVELMWGDDILEASIGDWSWSFDNDFWNNSTLKTTLPDIEFVTGLQPRSVNSLTESDDGFSLVMDELSMSVSGFASYVVKGNDENEEIVLKGTEGADYLYYSSGYGTFQTSDGQFYTFNAVNKVTIDGAGGDDYAYIEDSFENDQLKTYNNSLTMNGGGFTMTASNFPKSFVVFNKGGTDEYLSEDSGDDVQVVMVSGSSITTGAYVKSGAESDELVSYSRTVMGVEKTVLIPKSEIGSVLLDDKGASNVQLKASVGSLEAYDLGSARIAQISNVKNLTVSGVHPYSDNIFDVTLPTEYRDSVDGDYTVIVDTTNGWELRVPSWKIATASAGELDVIPEEALSFAFLDDYETFFDEDFECERSELDTPVNVEEEVVFEIVASSLKNDEIFEEDIDLSGVKKDQDMDSSFETFQYDWVLPFDLDDDWTFRASKYKKNLRHF